MVYGNKDPVVTSYHIINLVYNQNTHISSKYKICKYMYMFKGACCGRCPSDVVVKQT